MFSCCFVWNNKNLYLEIDVIAMSSKWPINMLTVPCLPFPIETCACQKVLLKRNSKDEIDDMAMMEQNW